MASVFTKIINREIPADLFYEDEKFIAILDINPVRDGHILVIPKKETRYIFELEDSEYLELMLIAKKVALTLEQKLKGKIDFSRIAVIVEGIEVPHVHVHLVPLHDSEGLTIGKVNKLSRDEVKKILIG
ncbi:MAG: histidine triad family protein [Patescibacteria group bacterium]|nr:histidine triad family protein [Patescibacteria group bacterium]